MERVKDWAEVGARVREARLATSLSQTDLARRMGLERTMVAKIEAGTRQLDALELFRLSDALSLPIDHFLLRPPAAIVSRRTPLTEADESVAARDAYRLEAELTTWLRDVEQMMSIGVLDIPTPATALRASDVASAQEAARSVRQSLGGALQPIGSMADVCERLGLLILVSELPGDGASVRTNAVGVAVVSFKVDPGRRRATAAHELGHFLLGDEYSSDLGVHASRDRRELLIDAFAAEFLAPVEALEARWPRESEGSTTLRAHAVKVSAEFRVSWSLLMRQLDRTGLVAPGVLTRWRNSPPTRSEFLDAAGWAPEPDLVLGQVPPRFSSAVIRGWEKSGISTSRTIELLRGMITAEDLPVREDEIEPS